MKHNNTWTIIKKEFARFFGDRQLVFTAIIMPGLLIYVIYTLMGSGIESMVNEGVDEVVVMKVENMSNTLSPMLTGLDDALVVVEQEFSQADIDALSDKDINAILLRFPPSFDEDVAHYDPSSGLPAPNVEIYYNATNNAVNRIYMLITSALTTYEDQMSNRFDVNRPESEDQHFDMADAEDAMGIMIWSKILPMLLMMMLFSGVMAIAPSAIAGEKERGTIATLLVTPMRRSELALGKIVSLSSIALLSGISSFIGIILSLPNIMQMGDEVSLGFNYAATDYLVLMLTIFSSVFIMASAVSLLSTLAKDVKNAGTMVTPLMLLVMLAGLLPMFQNGASCNLWVYFIPFYNCIEVMTAVFSHDMQWPATIVMLASNTAYTAVAVWGLTRLFNNEKVMFNR